MYGDQSGEFVCGSWRLKGSITSVSIFKKYTNKTLVTNLWHFLWNRLCQSQLKHLFSCLMNPLWQHCFPSHHCVEFPQKIYGVVLHQQLTKIARPNFSSALRVLVLSRNMIVHNFVANTNGRLAVLIPMRIGIPGWLGILRSIFFSIWTSSIYATSL